MHNGKRCDVGMLWAEDNIELPNNYFSALVQLKSMEKRLAKDQTLREKYSNIIKEDYVVGGKGYVVGVKDAHKVESTYHTIRLLTRKSRARFVGY